MFAIIKNTLIRLGYWGNERREKSGLPIQSNLVGIENTINNMNIFQLNDALTNSYILGI